LIEYKKYIKRYIDIFPRGNIKVVIFDDIVRNETTIYQEILQFLNATILDNLPLSNPDRNPSHALRHGWLRKILFIPFVQKWLHTAIPSPLLPIGANISKMIFKKNQAKPFVSNEEIKHLKNRYKHNVYELNLFLSEEKLINQDLLTIWGYR
jgi:hypothetical protein